MPSDVLLGIGLAAHLPCDAPLPLPDGHPVLHPGFQLKVSVVDDVVTAADPRVGLMHRSAEKLFEARDYRQAMLLANRHDWLSSFTSEVGVALAIEDALGLTPPERATWIRTVLVEAERILATLAFLGPIAGSSRGLVDDLRERMVSLQERVTGNRVHPGFARVGGVAGPLAANDLEGYKAVLVEVSSALPAVRAAVDAYVAPLQGVAVLRGEDAIVLGTSGVVARAGGFDFDLRRDAPSLAYPLLLDRLVVPTRDEGDVPARYGVLVDQLPVSIDLMRAGLDELGRLGPGPVDVPLPKVLRLPEGTTYAWLEGPLGISGCLLVSTGEKTPWRMKIRSASFATMQAMGRALAGTPLPALADAVMSFPMVLGDVDR